MDYRRYLSIIAVTILNLTIVPIYIKYVIFDPHSALSLKIFLKMLPCLLLSIHSIITYTINTENTVQKQVSKILIPSYLLCMMGDILLIMETQTTVGLLVNLIGGISFAVAHMIISLYTYKKIREYVWVNRGISLSEFSFSASAITGITILQIVFLSITFRHILQEKNSVNILSVVGITLYYIIITLSWCLTVVYYVIDIGTYKWIIGMSLFVVSDGYVIIDSMIYHSPTIKSVGNVLYWTGLTILAWSIV